MYSVSLRTCPNTLKASTYYKSSPRLQTFHRTIVYTVPSTLPSDALEFLLSPRSVEKFTFDRAWAPIRISRRNDTTVLEWNDTTILERNDSDLVASPLTCYANATIKSGVSFRFVTRNFVSLFIFPASHGRWQRRAMTGTKGRMTAR